ncbi:SIR2 family protein [Methylobacter sp.]|uniref:SIR2 family protein n=1 Tax=Methylobacter sp. TaxID=2051955 RepID=UPI001217E5CA|nr:SIR2 family protein [Methylobacter sp.]TAK64155.1 MAG: SIR2 family protein [Methylobacter sp.]
MRIHTHDPREHIRGVHQILINNKKRIGFLFGAGSSCTNATGISTIGVPVIGQMTKLIEKEAADHSAEFANAVQQIQQEIENRKPPFNIFNIESLLSSIEAKREVIGNGNLNGLDSAGFKTLANLVKDNIVKLVSVHEDFKSEDRATLAHSKFSSWVSNARRSYPVEIFTTNYDYLFEIALEGLGIPYFDGFSGSYEPFFCPEAVEDIDAYLHLVKLWKMHGSLGWVFRESDKAVIRKQANTVESDDESILIYPSHLKYNASKKQPYVGLIDRLCTFLQQDDAVLITCGYSFGDSHINERIATSLRRGANSHVIAMYYDKHGEENNPLYGLADEKDGVREMATNGTKGKMSVYGLRHAVIGGKFGKWKLRDEPKKDEVIQVDQYFDEDGAIPSDETGEYKGNEKWEGTGEFRLPDFCKLSEFLNGLSSSKDASGAENQYET